MVTPAQNCTQRRRESSIPDPLSRTMLDCYGRSRASSLGWTSRRHRRLGVLMQELRLRAAGTACARSQVTWLRDRLLKLGVQDVRSVRRLVLHLPRATPQREAWQRIALALGARAG